MSEKHMAYRVNHGGTMIGGTGAVFEHPAMSQEYAMKLIREEAERLGVSEQDFLLQLVSPDSLLQPYIYIRLLSGEVVRQEVE